MPEWTKQQQLWLLLQSVGLGTALGCIFDFFNVASKLRRRRRWLTFTCDVLFFLLAALVTFYFSLAVMDGRLHPLLFCGCLIGLGVQHRLVGRYVSGWIYRIGRGIYRLLRAVMGLFLRLLRPVFDMARRASAKMLKFISKTRKKSSFFQKNS